MVQSFIFCVTLLLFFLKVTCDWVEIPKISLKEKLEKRNNFLIMENTTPVSTIFLESTTTNDVIQIITKKQDLHILLSKNSSQANEMDKAVEVKQKLLISNATQNTNSLNDSFSEEIGDDEDNQIETDSEIVEETIEDAKRDLLDEQYTSITEKLKYLNQLEHKITAQIKQLSQGLWTDRQARGKKLLGFASMEGALLTIAFLTFAVFLVKIVHQFIQSLQNQDLTMIMALPTAPARRVPSRPKRQQRDLEAAQLLQYMDEFSIKHRLYCDPS